MFIDFLVSKYFCNKGKKATNKKEYGKALKYYEKSVEWSSSPFFVYYLGLAYFNLENFNKSIEYFDKALKLDSEFEDAFFFENSSFN